VVALGLTAAACGSTGTAVDADAAGPAATQGSGGTGSEASPASTEPSAPVAGSNAGTAVPSGAERLSVEPTEPACGSLPPAGPSGWLTEVLLGSDTVAPGATATARVNVRNTGTEPARLGPGSPLEVLLVERGGDTVVARHRITLDPADAGDPDEPIQPGGSLTLPILVPTEPCGDNVASALPAGGYELIVVVSSSAGQALRSERAPIVVA